MNVLVREKANLSFSLSLLRRPSINPRFFYVEEGTSSREANCLKRDTRASPFGSLVRPRATFLGHQFVKGHSVEKSKRGWDTLRGWWCSRIALKGHGSNVLSSGLPPSGRVRNALRRDVNLLFCLLAGTRGRRRGDSLEKFTGDRDDQRKSRVTCRGAFLWKKRHLQVALLRCSNVI